MALMSEGKPGPSKSKLRAIRRTYVRELERLRSYANGRDLRPLEADTEARLLAWISGKETPVGLLPDRWREVCKES